ncbi:MAG: DEAD/DEAH box helicase [Candidatus Woesearchaeota archaeon]|jgi:Fanconi anemia group M protein
MVDLISKEFKPRLYQEKIFDKTTKQNTLVVLPTGLGKTAIAAMLIAHRLENYPGSKILFLAPTKPLAQQHEKTLNALLNDSFKKVLFTGSVSPEKRKALWLESDIIISTPQGLENDVISRKINLENVSLLIFDEAHRAIGDYSYVFLAKNYIEKANHQRILALTASPGSNEETITQVCLNLFIDEVEFRSSQDIDVAPYVQEMNIEYVKVDLPDELKKIRGFLERCYSSKIEEASTLGFISNSVQSYTKSVLLSTLSGLHGKMAQGDKSFELLKTVSLIAEALKVQHAMELVETQGSFPLIEYFSQLEKQALTSNTKAVKNLIKDINFQSASILTKDAYEKKINHPKMDYLKRLISNELAKKKDAKIIIFTQFRDTASKIKEILALEGISGELFVGQAKKKNSGLSQKQQKEMIEKFEKEGFSCLIATSVGEEGLDIPEVELVVFYEPIPSAIRTVQRRGRTGRQKEGRVITLITKDTRDESYRWVAHHKEKRMYSVLKMMKSKINISDKKEDVKKITEFTKEIEEKVIIKVDYREKGSFVLKELLALNVDIDLASLQIADYHISEHVVIEYKKVKDFVDSIIDGRLLSQAKELKRYYQPIIIVEGEEDIYSQRSIHPNAIRGALAALMLGFRIPVLMTKNPKDTAAMIKLIAIREQKKDDRDFQMHSSKPLSDKEIQEYVVSSLPNIGTKLAPHLLKHFKSIKNIVNAEEMELKKVEAIGEKKAKRIKEIVNRVYDDE